MELSFWHMVFISYKSIPCATNLWHISAMSHKWQRTIKTMSHKNFSERFHFPWENKFLALDQNDIVTPKLCPTNLCYVRTMSHKFKSCMLQIWLNHVPQVRFTSWKSVDYTVGKSGVDRSGRAKLESKIENSNFNPSQLVLSQIQMKIIMSKLLL
jgi:hypothetical protein